jgi:NAD(P)-dependent dehydrogenase (short-subunit alcohol dehydrogenase family)
MLLKDRVCIVSGAASPRSIGYATAELFAEHGAKVVVADIAVNDDRGVRCDISSTDQCERLARDVLARFGTIDCLVNCAGVAKAQPMLDTRTRTTSA